ncbi:MAG TPA: peptidoglycan-binding domain-containing protein [Solirubrobacteraceae bacterium]|nr:peptidoglycan-binding domain-containing protein [Solirubrobacteraceae bacterium]
MRLRLAFIACAAVFLYSLLGIGAVEGRTPAPRLTGLRCVPAIAAGCERVVRVAVGRQIQLRGRNLEAGMRVTFRWPNGALATKLTRSRAGWTARVPPGTAGGRVGVTVRDRAGRRSNRRNIIVVAPPLRPLATTLPGELPAVFRGNGMWIWELARSDGGNVDAIAARAVAAGMQTVYVKSADAANVWKQFTPELVQALHARGLRVCAWQFVYGANPVGEAAAGAAAVTAGADCLVIDAETRYEGRYAAAQQYLSALRLAIGPNYPLALTSFPYVDFHPKFPYSVFLGPGGAQANLPQVYWKDIGGSVDAVSARTVAHNRIYRAPLAPLGQAYSAPAPEDLVRFRAIWAGYGAAGISWWSWQAASPATWATLTQPAPAPVVLADPGWPLLRRGKTGDQVIWMQQHLLTADPSVVVDGKFSPTTETALRTFQTARGLAVTGETDAATWEALLALAMRPTDWTAAPG